ncbi:MAG: response regulator transcription factor [Oscillospiraceae bacterium]|nr:response regulator transcription factor [Oscillospiraceae bacterium]
MAAILIVDDDLSIGNLLEEALTKEGYSVLRAYSGTEAVLLLRETRPDLVLLDMMLPGLSGEEVLPHLKGVPVIVVSAKIDVDDKVGMLLRGAADYVTKPFDIRELLARIAVQLRQSAEPEKEVLVHDELTLDLNSRTAAVNGQDARLTRTEYAILKLLMLNPRQVITKAQLLDRIGADTPDCTESSLKTHVSNLRRKLRELSDREYIEAVWGIGFKMAE